MDQSVLFVVDDDHLHHFVARDELGADVVSVLQSDLGVTVGETVLPIAHWEHDRTGPLSVALNFAGELVILVMAETFTDQTVLLNTLSTLEQWLAPMDLRDLGELSGDPNKFIEGLWELSPRAPLSLASMLRVLLLNPAIELDPDVVSASLPFSRVEELRIEALEAADGTVTIRRAHHVSDELADTLPLHDSSPLTIQLGTELSEPVVTIEDPSESASDEIEDVFADETVNAPAATPAVAVDVEVVASDDAIDLTIEEEERPSSEPSYVPRGVDQPTLIRGSHYVTAELPLHFDPTGASIEPISDELFAVGPHLSLVVDLDGRDETPVETTSIFRWDSEPEHRELFAMFEFDRDCRRRIVHVFVESASQPNRVFYLGTSDQLTQSDRSAHGAMWFKLRTPLDSRWFASLQAKSMPTATLDVTNDAHASFLVGNTQQPDLSGEVSNLDGDNGNWVPNV